MTHSSETTKNNILFIANQLGFSECRISDVKRATHADRYLDWVEQGCAGEMKWLERNKDRRVHPGEIVKGAKSVISLAYNYFPGNEHPGLDYKIARYAWNVDYHNIIEEKLKDLDLALGEMGGTQRYYVDTGPVLERDFATDAGLGWNGKSTVQIHPKMGNWFFLCELISTLDLEADSPLRDHCGKCTKCIDHCPTSAITGPRKMDARRCISYLTIENPGAIPLEFRKAIGDRIYGCDICLEVCPWNRFAKLSHDTKLHAKKVIFEKSLTDFLKLTPETFNTTFAQSPIKRIKHPRFLRNACVVAGNVGSEKELPQLRVLSESDDPLVAEHAQWAVEEIEGRCEC